MFTKEEKLLIAMYLEDIQDGNLTTDLPLDLKLRVELELASIFNHMSQDDKYNYGSPERFWLSNLNFELLGDM